MKTYIKRMYKYLKLNKWFVLTLLYLASGRIYLKNCENVVYKDIYIVEGLWILACAILCVDLIIYYRKGRCFLQ